MGEFVNPNNMCMGCMEEKETEGPCPHCGFDERAAVRPPQALPYRTILAGKYLVGKVFGTGLAGITYLGWDLNRNQRMLIQEYFPAGVAERGSTAEEVPSQANEASYAKGREEFAQAAQALTGGPGQAGDPDRKEAEVFEENNTVYLAVPYREGLDPEAWSQAQNLEELLQMLYPDGFGKTESGSGTDGPKTEPVRQPGETEAVPPPLKVELPVSEPPKKKGWKLPVFLLLGVLVIVAAVLGIRGILSSGGSEPVSGATASGNLLAGGYAAFDSEAVYFAGEAGIFRAEIAQGEPGEPELLVDRTGVNLIRTGEDLYFLESTGEEPGMIYRVRASDGRASRTIGEEKAYGFWVDGDHLYYLNEVMELCRMDLEGENLEALAEQPALPDSSSSSYDPGRYVVDGGWFYYLDAEESTLWRLSLEGGEPEQLSDDPVRYYVLDGGWTYCMGDTGIWRVDADGTQEEVLAEAAGLYNVLDSWVYYREGANLYRMQAEEQEPQALGEAVGWLYGQGSLIIQREHQTAPTEQIRYYWQDSEATQERQLLWESEENPAESAEAESSAETEAPTEAPTEPATEAPTETPAESSAEAETQEYDPEQWVYGGGEFPPLDSILNRIMEEDATVFSLGETLESDSHVRFTVTQVEISQSAAWMDGEAGMLVEVTAELLEDCEFSSLSHNSFSIMATNESTGDILLCRWDGYYVGGLEEAQTASQWETEGDWVPDGNTYTLRFPLPAGYEDWVLVFSNVSGGEPAGPVYLLFN